MDPLSLSINRFCETVGVGRTGAYHLINAGEVVRIKIGTRSLITYSSAKAFIDRKEAAATLVGAGK